MRVDKLDTTFPGSVKFRESSVNKYKFRKELEILFGKAFGGRNSKSYYRSKSGFVELLAILFTFTLTLVYLLSQNPYKNWNFHKIKSRFREFFGFTIF